MKHGEVYRIGSVWHPMDTRAKSRIIVEFTFASKT